MYNGSGNTVSKNARIFLLLILFALIFISYILRLFSMQIIHGTHYRSQSQRISSLITTLPAQRGEIFDRNANLPMVINTESFAVEVTPGNIPANMYDTVASRLAKYLSIPKSEIDKRIPKNIRRSYSSVVVKSNVPFSIISNIAENITDLPGVSWASKPVRNYLHTPSLSHIVGYVGTITQEEMNVLYNKGYTKDSIVGKTGIEKQYDTLLQGTVGREMSTIDVFGRVISDVPIVEPPKMGNNLVLTIDSDIQKLAEEALGNRVGATVVLKPATGEILAMVSYPYFDSNIFSSDDAGTEYAKLLNDTSKPLINRAVQLSYPPASTFKIIMSAAMLQENAYPSSNKIECRGFMNYGGRVFHCHIHKPGHGWLDLKNALAQSCDIYYWTIGRDYLGIEKISSYAKEFGLGQITQIDLPSQVPGLVPTAEWKEKRYHEKWLGGDTMSCSIGQGYLEATPLHLANMIAMVSNEGVIYKPHLLKEVRDSVTNEVISEVKPEILTESTIDKKVWLEVQEALRYTVTDGTPQYPMHNKLVQIACKTGTAEVDQYKSLNQWHSWLVAYAPYDAPPEERVCVATIVEAVNKWEWWAPYCTNIIIQGIFAHQTYAEAIKELGFEYLNKNVGRRE
ncbi:penicillin-binding protein 2 [Treponema sp. C6A8]|uniref:penicillin-binding protein 2 n=1 Tax=Treponema sp. C6A8 TaxID=1410609 RepID=UPI00048372EC|nr:penicillin-binding protein 2 [Treponema sp. C6A8]